MELGPLKTFLVLARVGHMTRAAGELHLTQPAVSAQLAKLEDELGERLFDRTSRGMQLTEAGATFRPFVERALSQLNEGQASLEALRGLERGTLAIGGGATATTYLLPPLLGQFHARYPAIRLFVRELGSQRVVEALMLGELDIGVITLPVMSATAGQGRVRLHIEPWIDDELRLIVPPDDPLAQHQVFAWADLHGKPFVLFEAGSAVRTLIDTSLATAQIGVQIVMELRSIESIKQMVAQGIGAAFVSRFALPRGQEGLRGEAGRLERQLALVYREDRTLRAAARAFIELMRQRAEVG